MSWSPATNASLETSAPSGRERASALSPGGPPTGAFYKRLAREILTSCFERKGVGAAKRAPRSRHLHKASVPLAAPP
eukprot:2926651-Pyramimonas_sp.AAC.1